MVPKATGLFGEIFSKEMHAKEIKHGGVGDVLGLELGECI
jgi:hypothetical protein